MDNLTLKQKENRIIMKIKEFKKSFENVDGYSVDVFNSNRSYKKPTIKKRDYLDKLINPLEKSRYVLKTHIKKNQLAHY